MTDVEIDPRAALAEEGESPSLVEPEQDQPEIDVIDTIEPKVAHHKWTVDDKTGNAREYVQKPLGYFQKMTFFSLVGEVIDKAVAGEDGLRISSLLDTPGTRGRQLTAADFRDADTFVQAIGKLLTYAPDFLQKCYCIWWSVPVYERDWVIETISKTPEEGGLTDDEGVEALEIFIDQNWDSLEAFFREKIASVRDRVLAHRQTTDSESPPSKPSNGTQPPTPKP